MRPLTSLVLFAPLVLVGAAAGQSFQIAAGNLPTNNPNTKSSENVDFADVDGDGDWDALVADGGDDGNQRNRLWINQGGLQGGTPGVFLDDTPARVPSGQDTSRDVEFADFDGDGDYDVAVANTSTFTNQASRLWVNQGGLQGGSEGFYVDDTLARWAGVGQSGSSVATSRVLVAGGWITYAADIEFGDFDGNGSPDVFLSNQGAGQVGGDPSLVFLNDGAGAFTEFNPSGFQLVEPGFILNTGEPGLWCEGIQQHKTTNTTGAFCDISTYAVDSDLGDLDGDLDIDVLQGDRNEDPRVILNRSDENGGPLSFRDVTGDALVSNAIGGGNYEQELGDFDGDDDLDIYGVNWGSSAGLDWTLANDGGAIFSVHQILASSGSDDEEADFFDYDADGDLDVYVSNFAGSDRLYEQDATTHLFTSVPAELPAGLNMVARDSDAADLDGDGDYDLIVCQDNFTANLLLENITQTPDTTAPRVVKLEQVADRSASTVPTRVRVHVYDNAPYYVTWYNATTLEYRVDGGDWNGVPMASSGGQVFRGEIPGERSGTVDYRVRSADEHGNTGVSAALSYVAACDGEIVNYCTAGTSAGGCQVTLTASGVPSASAASGFALIGAAAPGQINGLFFFGTGGRLASPWGSTSSYKCVAFPSRRTQLLSSGGTGGACDGTFSADLNARWTAKPAQNPGAGAVVDAQLWYRDAGSAGNPKTAFSDGAEFVVCP